MTPSDAYEVRVARLERDVTKIQDNDKQDVILERVDNLSSQVRSMRVALWTSAALLCSVLGVLLTILKVH